jgi:hypothetical protein
VERLCGSCLLCGLSHVGLPQLSAHVDRVVRDYHVLLHSMRNVFGNLLLSSSTARRNIPDHFLPLNLAISSFDKEEVQISHRHHCIGSRRIQQVSAHRTAKSMRLTFPRIYLSVVLTALDLDGCKRVQSLMSTTSPRSYPT